MSNSVKPWDFLNPNTEFADKTLVKQRLDTCKECDRFFQATMQCKECGCFMHLKTRLKDATCPLGKW